MKRDVFKDNIKSRFRKPIGYVIWILVIFLFFSAFKNVGKVSRVRREIEREKERIAKIEAENKALEEKVALTQSSEFIEKEIRNKLGLVKEGEVIVVLPDEETLKKLAPEVPQDIHILPDPNWKKWIKVFVN